LSIDTDIAPNILAGSIAGGNATLTISLERSYYSCFAYAENINRYLRKIGGLKDVYLATYRLPKFHWDEPRLAPKLGQFRHDQGPLLCWIGAFGFKWQEQALLQMLTDDVAKTNEIEGEWLNVSQ